MLPTEFSYAHTYMLNVQVITWIFNLLLRADWAKYMVVMNMLLSYLIYS